MKRKILLYGDLNLNIVDGSSVWLVSLAKLLAKDTDNVVDILLKEKIVNNILIKDLTQYDNVSFLNSDEYLPKEKSVDISNIVKIMNRIDELRDYSCIIVRGFNAVNTIIKNEKISDKLIPYLTDFCHDKEKISSAEIEKLIYIYNHVKQFFVQTTQMRDYLKDVLKKDGEKFKLLNPMIFKEDLKVKPKMNKTIVYAGKIALGWNILELIEIMDKIYKKDKEITLHFIGDKFNRDLAGRKDEILSKLKSMPNVVFYGSLPKQETTEIVNSCELGYSFRSTAIDNDHSLELSSKILEYCFCNIPLILRRTKMHEDVLGKDYPLFTESVDDCVEKILTFFNNKEKYSKLSQNLEKCVERFSTENVYKSVVSALEVYPKKKMRLLISGHDLKFIKPLFPYFEKEFELTVQEIEEYSNLDITQSKTLLGKADIVWCEWLLLNAKWYSNHVYAHQKLFIRAHRFEIAKNYGSKVRWNRVNLLITVSYYYMENFMEKFKIPRDKITVINNFIDVNSYSTEKKEGYKYNLAMIGILPKRKGFDKAIDLLISLKKKNPKYKLYIAGKRPDEFPNTKTIPEEREYYKNVDKKIKENNLEDSVIYSGWVKTQDFLKNIGYTLSLSDKDYPESFHVSPFECMASNGIGLSLEWEGIEYIYPEYVICKSIEEIAQKIEDYNNNDKKYDEFAKKGREFTRENYDLPLIWNHILKILENRGAMHDEK